MERVVCEICGTLVELHASYIVRVDVFADPSMPATTTSQIQATDFDSTISDLIEQMAGLSTDEMEDQVHRHFEYRICTRCQPLFLVNPLGKPRTTKPAEN
ncbi:MAG: hypothetical protein M3O30_00435 [Planctomycetota bacterium]|nr:hypothetical protein [Planctomycetota bacterium]